MMSKKEVASLFILILGFLLILNLINAEMGNPAGDIENQYGVEESIKGWINISFNNSLADAKFKDSFNNEISIIDVLKKRNYNYSCNPIDCLAGFQTTGNEENSKVINNQGNSYFGFLVSGSNVDINGINFDISSNAGASCSSQLSIDLIDDGIINWENPKYINEDCGASLKSSCYSSFGEWATIDNGEFYCEQISLPKAPAFEIVAKFKFSGSGFNSGDLKAWIWNGEFLGSCNLTQPTSNGGDVSCVIPYVNKKAENHYICIRKEASGGNGYSLDYRSAGNFCGAAGVPSSSQTHVADYNIFAKAKKYASVGSFEMNNSVYSNQNNGDSIVSAIDYYIEDRFERDCSNGCLIPVKVLGSVQDITISDININYVSDGAPGGTTKDKSYELDKSAALISSEFLKLNIEDLDFYVPNEIGKKQYSIYLDSEKIIEEEINITSEKKLRILQVYPQKAAVARPTNFAILADSEINITNFKFSWNFGDGSGDLITNTNKITHTFSSLGNYTLKVKALDNGEEISSKEFTIDAISPKEAINETIIEYKRRVSDVKNQRQSFSIDYQNLIDEAIDIDEILSGIDSIETRYKQLNSFGDTTDEEYISLMQELVALEVPVSIGKRSSSEIVFFNDPSNVDLSEVSSIFLDQYFSSYEEEYINALGIWFISNLDVTLKHEILSIYYEDSIVDFLTKYNFAIEPKSSLGYDGYLMIDETEDNIIFLDSYDVNGGFDSTGVRFSLDQKEDISFIIKGGIELFELPAYITPQLDELDINTGAETPIEEPGFRWGRFIFGMIILLISALAVYIFLQEWYKHNYEIHLFKNKSDLFNLMSFIQNARKQGLNDAQIRLNLKKTSWTGEQISYATKKLDGKRVGMWEIPILMPWEKRKIKKEMEKRAPRRVI